MSNVLEIPDAGTLSVKFGGSQFTLDAYELWNRVLTVRDQCNEAELPTHEFHARVVELLAEKGLPRLNHYQADQFVKRLAEAVDSLGKVNGTAPTPDSPVSTEPVPSNSPAA